MNGRVFTLQDANHALALVRPIVREAVRQYGAAKQAIDELGVLRSRRASGQPVAAEDLAALELGVETEIARLTELVDELEALGCYLRDYELGVVDFPAAALGPDGLYLYCWELGEPAVTHWRAEHEPHAQRRLVPA